jgi:hypothetical protein
MFERGGLFRITEILVMPLFLMDFNVLSLQTHVKWFPFNITAKFPRISFSSVDTQSLLDILAARFTVNTSNSFKR